MNFKQWESNWEDLKDSKYRKWWMLGFKAGKKGVLQSIPHGVSGAYFDGLDYYKRLQKTRVYIKPEVPYNIDVE